MRKHKRDFSKSIYIYNLIFVTVIVIASFTLMFLSGKLAIIDLSPVSIIIPSAFAELGLHTGFYIWKSKIENCRKYLSATERLEMSKLEMTTLTNEVRGETSAYSRQGFKDTDWVGDTGNQSENNPVWVQDGEGY